MNQSIIELYDEYTHKPLPRRVFLRRLAGLAGGTAAALALLPLLETNQALAEMVPANDPRLETSEVRYDSPAGPIRAYLAHPKGAGRRPAVMVIHENRGLNPHIQDVARRLALEGFLALAPDALTPQGGTPSDEDKARDMIGKIPAADRLQLYLAGISYLKPHAGSTGKVGCVGFCWGGGVSNLMAVNSPDLAAAVVFYGASPRSEDAAKIKVPLLLHYAGLDSRINAGIPDYEAALKAARVKYEKHVYDGVNHAFHNDTAASRYNEAAARLAWGRSVAFFKSNLG
jgi:carboxymethylenebutenolidase